MNQKPVGFSKILTNGKGSFSPPVCKTLNHDSNIGDYVSHKTTLGNIYRGILKKWDFNIATIELEDGIIKAILLRK